MPPKGRLFGGKSKAGKIFMFLLTYALVSQALYTTTCLALTQWTTYPALTVALITVHTLLLLLAMWAHWMCANTDPGYVPELRDDQIIVDAVRWGFTDCTKCKSIRPRRAHHCSACGRCVLHMDHHCPWVVNCVGMFNQKFFIQYTAYIFLAGAMEIALACVVGYDMYDLYCTNVSRLLSKYGAALMVATTVMFFLSVPFSMFAVTLFIDQLCNVNRNTTAIDQLKGIPARRQPFIQSLSRVLGGRPGLTWLLPLPMKPRYLNDELTSSDIVALSIFDDAEAALSDRNHELLGLDAAEEQGCARRRCAFKAATCRWKTDAVNDDS